ncbi:MAG TPA: cytochrome c oxidase assembly protein [Usitatibacter sp.]|jgi:cytochrome c oxidase assembly protein subunit 11|nr:cytochrome c oxidase assembly protein [Usitatibacter sp.]
MSTVPAGDLDSRNRLMLRKILVICLGMLAFAFAMVPIYKQVCKAVGIDQDRVLGAGNTQVDPSRMVEVQLVASTAGLPWRFEALDHSVRMHPGELVMVRYKVENTLGRPVVAQAVMSTAPERAHEFIEKQQCFCFTNQKLAPGESRVMPVVFRVKADAPRDLESIVLSYSFLEVPQS